LTKRAGNRIGSRQASVNMSVQKKTPGGAGRS
jgi:hypothetical protein